MYLLLFLVVSRQMSWALIALIAGLSFQLACIYDALNWGLDLFYGAVGRLSLRRRRGVVFPSAATAGGLRRRSLPDVPLPRGSPTCSRGARYSPRRTFSDGATLIDTVCFAIVVSGLSDLSEPAIRSACRARIDRTLGEWSYFAFLVHWLAAFLVASILLDGEWRGWTLLLAVTPVVLVASAALAGLNRNSWSRCAAGCAALMEDRDPWHLPQYWMKPGVALATRNIPPSIRRGKIIWQANWPTRDDGRQLGFRSSRDSGALIIRSRRRGEWHWR